MRRRPLVLSPSIVLLLAGGAACVLLPAPGLDAAPPSVVASGLDRDGDGHAGEASAIHARALHYLQSHGAHDRLTPAVQLRRMHWSYSRWLDRVWRRVGKRVEGEGWISLGPVNGAGRATAIVPHPTRRDTLLVGAAGGGVWRTVDGGQSWTPLTEGLPDLSVGALVYAPSDPDVVYLGSGEGGLALDFIPGAGLFRSLDGGDTWIVPDKVVASQFYALSVDPRDPETLLAATNEGLLRSTDGGDSWSSPIPSSAALAVTEVVRAPDDPDTAYAALWCVDSCRAGYARVMRSTDGGQSWTRAASGLPLPEDGYSLNRLALALAPSDPDRLYCALTSAASDDGDPVAHVYASANGGSSWSEVGRPERYLGSQGWYDNTITVDPSDPQRVVAGGVWYVVSSDGGTTWKSKSPYESGGAFVPHVDAHHLAWQGDTLWLACDGGVWSSDDAGETWTERNSGLVTRQYYGLAIDPVNRERVIAGSQDNGTNRRRDIGDDTWDLVLGGDGFECAINPLLPEVAYGTIYNTRIYRSLAGGAAGWVDVSPGVGSDGTPFLTPLTMRPDEPTTLYTGSTRVWVSDDGGDSWTSLSTSVENGLWNDDDVWAIALTPADPELVMVAKNQDLYVSQNDGRSWRAASRGAGGLSGARVVNVAISPFDPDLALACMAGGGEGRILRTTDRGLTWSAADDGLPPFAVQVARFDPTDRDIVYAGTDVGLYRSLDGGLSWSMLGDGLPAASVHDIRILDDGSMLRVATHGRGVWELAVPPSANRAPTVEVTAPDSGVAVAAGDTLRVAARASDPDGDSLSLDWVFTDRWRVVDGGSGVGALEDAVSYRFDVGGVQTIGVNARDTGGASSVASISVTVSEPADDCSSPRIVPPAGPFPHTVVTSNELASTAFGDPTVTCVAQPGDQWIGRWGSLWFELTPAESGRYAISTCGSLADTVLSAWSGDACGPYTLLTDGCNDDDELAHCSDGRRTDSYLELDLEAGETYRLMVGAYASSSRGRLRLTVDCLDCSERSGSLRHPSGRLASR